MKLTLDGKPLDVTEESHLSVRAIVERVVMLLKPQLRTISEIFVDGKQMGSWDDPDFIKITVGGVTEMQIISEEPRKLANKVLYEIASYMPKIQKALVDTSEKIQSRKEEEGMALLGQLTSTWIELYEGFQSAVKVTGTDLNAILVNGRAFIEINDEIHNFLYEVSTMVEEQRMLELSDILEYEIAPRIPLIEEGIYQIIKASEKKPH